MITSRVVCLLLMSAITESCLGGRNNSSEALQTYPNTTRKMKSISERSELDIRDNCDVSVDPQSINFFRSRLNIAEPNFIRFSVVFRSNDLNQSRKIYPNFTQDTFYPYNWVWTYKSNRGLYPYLRWNADYSILSFGLLDAKTLWSEPYILFNVRGRCNLTMGTKETTNKIAEQLKVLVSKLNEGNKTITQYEQSYWCYLAETKGFRKTLGYYMGLYLLYQISVINYNCCRTWFDYPKSIYKFACMDEQMHKWVQCTDGPYILGMLLFLYSPIILFQTAASAAARDKVNSNHSSDENESTPLLPSEGRNCQSLSESLESDEKWLYLNGKFPKTFFGLFTSLFPNKYPVGMSRLKRLLFVILGPSIVFLQILIYKERLPDMTAQIVGRGVPVGFLSLLGHSSREQMNAFVPAFGGPVALLTSYYVLGVLFLVFPRSVQDVIENGIQWSISTLNPLCLTAEEIKELSCINVTDKPGYRRAANLFLCSFYMLFRGSFWKTVFKMQSSRFIDTFWIQSGVCKYFLFLLLPTYILVCIGEIVLCVVYYSVPLLSFIVIIVRGAIKTIAITIRGGMHTSDRSILAIVLKNRLIVLIFSLLIAVLFLFYVYSFCLVFIQSFFFLSQILIYCYVAVIVYPTVSFGYLFFAVILLYYIFRLIRAFGAKYLDLQNDVVEIVMRMEEQDNYITVFDGNLVIANIKISRLKSIKINNILLHVPQNILQRVQGNQRNRRKLSFKNNTYGISKDLFEYVVKKHLPVHQQALRVVFHLALIVLFLLVTISLTTGFLSGPTSELSDVMHVIFIVTVGALPRVLEVALLDSSEHIYRDIKLRRLEDTISEYWQLLSEKERKETASSTPTTSLQREMEHMSFNN